MARPVRNSTTFLSKNHWSPLQTRNVVLHPIFLGPRNISSCFQHHNGLHITKDAMTADKIYGFKVTVTEGWTVSNWPAETYVVVRTLPYGITLLSGTSVYALAGWNRSIPLSGTGINRMTVKFTVRFVTGWTEIVSSFLPPPLTWLYIRYTVGKCTTRVVVPLFK